MQYYYYLDDEELEYQQESLSRDFNNFQSKSHTNDSYKVTDVQKRDEINVKSDGISQEKKQMGFLFLNRFQRQWENIGLQILQQTKQFNIEINKKYSKEILKKILQDPNQSPQALELLQNPKMYKEVFQFKHQRLEDLMMNLINKFYKHISQSKSQSRYQVFTKLKKEDKDIEELFKLLQQKISFNTKTRWKQKNPSQDEQD